MPAKELGAYDVDCQVLVTKRLSGLQSSESIMSKRRLGCRLVSVTPCLVPVNAFAIATMPTIQQPQHCSSLHMNFHDIQVDFQSARLHIGLCEWPM